MDTSLAMVVWADGSVCDCKDVESESSSSSTVSNPNPKKSNKEKNKGSRTGKSSRKASKSKSKSHNQPKSIPRKERACNAEKMSGNYSTWKKTPVHSLFAKALC